MPTSRSRPTIRAYWLGSVPYREAWDLQQAMVSAIRDRRWADTLLLLEHPHVFTLGRRGTLDHVLWDDAERQRRGVDLVFCDRGGDVTYHGPGQLVGYPLLDLRGHGSDILLYLRRLEASLVDYLARLGVAAAPVEGLTGVWAGDAKVAAIGVKLTDTVVSHGFALNLTTDLSYFGGIVPCGLAGKAVTSVAQLGVGRHTTEAAAREYSVAFSQAFDVQLTWADPAELAALPRDSRPAPDALQLLPS